MGHTSHCLYDTAFKALGQITSMTLYMMSSHLVQMEDVGIGTHDELDQPT